MKKIACEACGSTDLVKQGDYFVCQYCGVKYTQADIKKTLGTVRIDNAEKVNNLYQLARRARDDKKNEDAVRYYDMILLEDPNSWEAAFYQVYCKATGSAVEEILAAAISVENSIDTVLKLIRDHVDNQKRVARRQYAYSNIQLARAQGEDTVDAQEDAVNEVCRRCSFISCELFSTAKQYYDGIRPELKKYNTKEMRDRCYAATKIMYTLGNSVDRIFPESYNMNYYAFNAWESGISLHKNLLIYYYSEEEERHKKIIMAYVNQVKKYNPSYKPPEPPQTGCYVATCVYGSYDCPQVWTLRRYRDYTLNKTWCGRIFIHMYYAISPNLVKRFGKTLWFKRMWKGRLDRLVNILNNHGIESTPYNDKGA
jgi:hypothetical protein